jgi:hypothetical protein
MSETIKKKNVEVVVVSILEILCHMRYLNCLLNRKKTASIS